MEYETHEHDVLVIGAGGAGLRAAIEASAAGVSVGLVCKSLLGKAHTVMAEGGIAAALANVDNRDNWRVHFADTMRGGQYVNNWRMAELHAQEAADRVRELEAWGAVFDRTKDGRILQRNFGGHKYPRLAHVGDRTGLEMIRTLQDHGIHQGMSVYMECTIIRLLKDGDRISGAFGYYRERGRFVLFKAKAVVLATGGIGKAYKITSNSWEYTGDGHSLAYHAGAELIDMEFIQFHPTGMVWPPSVRGILVTEGVRGEGGVLRNSEGKRFMFGDIPDSYKHQTADNEEEGFLYVLGEKFQAKDSRRPPELLTRDHVARCIVREVKQGRGSPHGGVLLELETFAEWMRKRQSSFNAAEHWKKKLPSMYHQFKELGNVDITRQPMEVGPTTHYIMGGVRVDADTQMSNKIPGLFACGECAAGINGANRLGGNSLSDLLVLGKRAGEYAAKYAKDHGSGKVQNDQADEAARWALSFIDEPKGDENPYLVQQDLQEVMQDLVGIVRKEEEMVQALGKIADLNERAKRVHASINREYNPGWHTCMDLRNLMTVSEAIARAAIERKESRGGQFRDDFPRKDNAKFGKVNTIVWQAPDGTMQFRFDPIPAMPANLQEAVREQNDGKLPEELAQPALNGKPLRKTIIMAQATFKIWRGNQSAGEFKEYTADVGEGMVVLDCVHQIQATQASDLACRWNCKAGKCGSCSAEINGRPRLMCMTRMDDERYIKPGETVIVEPMRAFPLMKDLVTDVSWNYKINKMIPPFQPRKPDAADGTWRMSQEEVDRVQEFRKCIECFLCQDTCHVLRDHDKKEGEVFGGPRFMIRVASLEMHPLDTGDRLSLLKNDLNIGLCNITKCCTEVCPEHIHITDNGIIPLKERVVDAFYDPLLWVWRKLFGSGEKRVPLPVVQQQAK